MLNRVTAWSAGALVSCLASMGHSEQLPDPLAAGWKGEPVCKKLHEDEALRVLRCSFAPGVGHERHFHPPHVGYTLEGGKMQVTDATGTRTLDVPTGTTFANPEGIAWHQALNVGATTTTYLMIEPKAAPAPLEE